jgi:hypothetical protein
MQETHPSSNLSIPLSVFRYLFREHVVKRNLFAQVWMFFGQFSQSDIGHFIALRSERLSIILKGMPVAALTLDQSSNHLNYSP